MDLPAHGIPLSGEIFHSQVLVRCGPVQAEHECWGQSVEGGVTEMGNPDRHRETRWTASDPGWPEQRTKGNRQEGR